MVLFSTKAALTEAIHALSDAHYEQFFRAEDSLLSFISMKAQGYGVF